MTPRLARLSLYMRSGAPRRSGTEWGLRPAVSRGLCLGGIRSPGGGGFIPGMSPGISRSDSAEALLLGRLTRAWGRARRKAF